MLQINNLSYQVSGNVIFKDASWTIHPGKKIALIGPNGAGKTTLLRILNSDLEATSGEIIKPRQYTIGYLPQEEVYVGKGNLLETVRDVFAELNKLEKEIEDLRQQIAQSGDHSQLVRRLGELEHQFETMGGYRLESEAKKVLMGLGFSQADFTRPLTEFSGGWQMRAYLAKLLLQNPDLLLLDEPTNHLDLESLEWLEAYLIDFKGSIIFVSHDRFFIDRLAEEITELEFKKLICYGGNYNFYEQQKELHRQQLIQKAEEQKQERERLTRFIERFRYKNTKASQVQSRVKMLEKMERIEIPQEQKSFKFKIQAPVKSFKEVCQLQNVCFKYDDPWVIKDINLNLYRGEKVALVGVNGAGKTTLTRLIAREYQPQKGIVKIGERVSIGYYAQHQIDALNLNNKVMDEVLSTADDSIRPMVRDVLGIFQISGDDVDKKISVLSGGEKARVSLAKILVSPVNFLIMDEPTNHLDLYSKKALEQALFDYDGTLLLISHDRYFLDKLVSRVIELKNGSMRVFEGNYTDYLHKRNEQHIIAERPNDSKADLSKNARKEQKRLEAQARQQVSAQRKELRERITQCEMQIEQLEMEKHSIENQMADPDFYKDENRAAQIGKRYQELQYEIPIVMENWENTNMQLEKLLGDLKKQSD